MLGVDTTFERSLHKTCVYWPIYRDHNLFTSVYIGIGNGPRNQVSGRFWNSNNCHFCPVIHWLNFEYISLAFQTSIQILKKTRMALSRVYTFSEAQQSPLIQSSLSTLNWFSSWSTHYSSNSSKMVDKVQMKHPMTIWASQFFVSVGLYQTSVPNLSIYKLGFNISYSVNMFFFQQTKPLQPTEVRFPSGCQKAGHKERKCHPRNKPSTLWGWRSGSPTSSQNPQTVTFQTADVHSRGRSSHFSAGIGASRCMQ